MILLQSYFILRLINTADDGPIKANLAAHNNLLFFLENKFFIAIMQNCILIQSTDIMVIRPHICKIIRGKPRQREFETVQNLIYYSATFEPQPHKTELNSIRLEKYKHFYPFSPNLFSRFHKRSRLHPLKGKSVVL